MTPFSAFFGDQEYTFLLTPELVRELETKCGGIGALSGRVFARQFAQSDITETVRLALVGGGTSPKRAAELVAVYVQTRPLIETYELAAKVLEKTFFGDPHETSNG